MVTITLYMRQQKRHRCIEQTFGPCGRGRGWDDLGEWHWNIYIIICETNRQSRFDAQGWCTGMTQRDGMVREVGGGLRMENTCTPVVDSCWCMAKPIQYCKVISLQLKWINLYFKKELFPRNTKESNGKKARCGHFRWTSARYICYSIFMNSTFTVLAI